jgi:hypothetical protein
VKRNTAREIWVSNNWHKSWIKAREGFPGVDAELQDFYQDKVWFDPPISYGKKDGPLGSNIPRLKGMAHVHMHFGKVVVIYKVEADVLKMYVAGNHKMVESGGLAALGDLVYNLNNGNWQQIPAPEFKMDTPAVQHSPEQAQAVQVWCEMLDTDHAASRALRQFASDMKNYWQIRPYVDMDPTLKTMQVATLHELVVAYLQQ